MSEISKTTNDGAELREDGSKIATEERPSGETETEARRRQESKLPNKGISPDYKDAEQDDRIAAPSPPTGA